MSVTAERSTEIGPAFGVGLVTRGSSGRVLEVYYFAPRCGTDPIAAILSGHLKHSAGNRSYSLTAAALAALNEILGKSSHRDDENVRLLRRIQSEGSAEAAVVTFLDTDTAPASTEEVYLKLALLSHRLAQPHMLNLDNIFHVLPNVAWTSDGPIEIEDLPERQLAARLRGQTLEVFSVDKFPKMVNHVVPSQIRIADGARVRFGAYLGPGTTVMQAGFINFNAGTAGPNMVEGRISSGVFVDSGTDLGGASSTLGTLSGGNTALVRIGKNCLIGANAGAGISLGDNSTIEAGLYVTGGSKVELLDRTGKKVGLVKARDLAGRPGLLFRRNSATGRVEAIEGAPSAQLNESLHINR